MNEFIKLVLNADSTLTRTTNRKSKLTGGSLHHVDEINDKNLNEIPQKNMNL